MGHKLHDKAPTVSWNDPGAHELHDVAPIDGMYTEWEYEITFWINHDDLNSLLKDIYLSLINSPVWLLNDPRSHTKQSSELDASTLIL